MLSGNEIAEFKEQGFVVKRGVALDPCQVERVVERVWRELPDRFRRDAPDTWTGSVTDSCRDQAVDQRLGRVKFRECVWTDAAVLALGPNDPTVRAVARQLLGEHAGAIGESASESDVRRARGIYIVLPAPTQSHRLKPHFDRHVFQFGMVRYLSHVTADGGAFTVWPGSHRWLSERIGMQEGLVPEEDRRRLLEEFAWRPVSRPLPIAGSPGDVVFYHHRMLHAAGINRTQSIRYAVLADFARDDLWRAQRLLTQANPWENWAI